MLSSSYARAADNQRGPARNSHSPKRMDNESLNRTTRINRDPWLLALALALLNFKQSDRPRDPTARRVRLHAKAIIEGRAPWPRGLLAWKTIHELRGADCPWNDEANLTPPQRALLARQFADSDARWRATQARSNANHAARMAALDAAEHRRAKIKAAGPLPDETMFEFFDRLNREAPRASRHRSFTR